MFNETSRLSGVKKQSKLDKIAAINPERAARLAARQGLPTPQPSPVIQPAPKQQTNITLPEGGGVPVPSPAPSNEESGILDTITGFFGGIPKNYIIIGAVVVGFFLLKKR